MNNPKRGGPPVRRNPVYGHKPGPKPGTIQRKSSGQNPAFGNKKLNPPRKKVYMYLFFAILALVIIIVALLLFFSTKLTQESTGSEGATSGGGSYGGQTSGSGGYDSGSGSGGDSNGGSTGDDECILDSDCTGNKICVSGECVYECTNNSDCDFEDNEICMNYECVEIPMSCDGTWNYSNEDSEVECDGGENCLADCTCPSEFISDENGSCIRGECLINDDCDVNANETCVNNICVPQDCVNESITLTCSGVECGIKTNNCGYSVDCGGCNTGYECTSANVCVPIASPCIPLTCDSYECSLGDEPDGCGGFINCGTCPTGEVCEYGECVQDTSSPECSDSDGPTGYYTKGTVTDVHGVTKTDFCYTTESVTEYRCEIIGLLNPTFTGEYDSRIYTCPYGCSGGACIGPEPWCDYDGVCDAGETLTGCPSDCQPICGNNILEGEEGCDDGNNITEYCEYGETSCIVCNSTCDLGAGNFLGFCGDENCMLGENIVSCLEDCSNNPEGIIEKIYVGEERNYGVAIKTIAITSEAADCRYSWEWKPNFEDYPLLMHKSSNPLTIPPQNNYHTSAYAITGSPIFNPNQGTMFVACQGVSGTTTLSSVKYNFTDSFGISSTPPLMLEKWMTYKPEGYWLGKYLITSERALCVWSLDSGLNYNEMIPFSETDYGTIHQKSNSIGEAYSPPKGLYTYYIKCKDKSGNIGSGSIQQYF